VRLSQLHTHLSYSNISGEAWSLPFGFTFFKGSNFTLKCKTRVCVTASDKHSSLLFSRDQGLYSVGSGYANLEISLYLPTAIFSAPRLSAE
jgi:hypothetical protein